MGRRTKLIPLLSPLAKARGFFLAAREWERAVSHSLIADFSEKRTARFAEFSR